jgi:hypothetical protein
MKALRIAQPGAYTANTQPRRAAQRSPSRKHVAHGKDLVHRRVTLANHASLSRGRHVVAVLVPLPFLHLCSALYASGQPAGSVARTNATVTLAHSRSTGRRLRAIYPLAIALAPQSLPSCHSLLTSSRAPSFREVFVDRSNSIFTSKLLTGAVRAYRPS